MTNGIVYIALGKQSQDEVKISIKSLNQHNDIPITVVDKNNTNYTDKQASRYYKTQLPLLINNYDKILYLDADTRINGDVSIVFNLLDEFDMAIALSSNQDADIFRHIKTGERLQTIREMEFLPLQFQCGVMAFHRKRCTDFFQLWCQEWLKWKDQDQAAFIRAYYQIPIRIWILGQDWNGGDLISHLFGRCR